MKKTPKLRAHLDRLRAQDFSRMTTKVAQRKPAPSSSWWIGLDRSKFAEVQAQEQARIATLSGSMKTKGLE